MKPREQIPTSSAGCGIEEMMVFLAWDSCMTILHGKVVVQAALCGFQFLLCMGIGNGPDPDLAKMFGLNKNVC